MQTLNNAALTYALNALWLVPLLVLAVECLAKLLRRVRAGTLHCVWLGCLVLSLTAPCLPFLHDQTYAFRDLVRNPQGTLAREVQLAKIQPKSPGTPRFSSFSLAPEKTPEMGTRAIHLPAIVFNSVYLLYLASVFFALSRLGFGLWRTRVLLKGAERAVLTPDLEESWKSWQAAFGRERIEILSSSKLSSPATINWPRPIVILPATMRDAEPGELTAVFCHELAHIRRRDFLSNILIELLAVPLFFHPALHWIRRRIQETRELACDDMAAEAMAARHNYAHHLLQLARKMRAAAGIPQPGCALGIFEGEILEKRIVNLIEKKTKQSALRLILSLILGSSLVLGTCALGAAFGLAPALAQATSQADHIPAGWFMSGNAPANYRAGVESAVTYDGQPSAYLESVASGSAGFGTLMQTIGASNYAGKRVRLRASVQSKEVGDWAGMWMRVDRDQTMVAFDNMQDRAIKGTQPWRIHDVVLDVPTDATSISFGVLLSGSGKVWMNHLSFETVGLETEVTSGKASRKPPLSASPVNLSFKE